MIVCWPKIICSAVILYVPWKRLERHDQAIQSGVFLSCLVSSAANGQRQTMAEAPAAATPACCAACLLRKVVTERETMAKYPLHVLPALRCDYRRWHPAADTRVPLLSLGHNVSVRAPRNGAFPKEVSWSTPVRRVSQNNAISGRQARRTDLLQCDISRDLKKKKTKEAWVWVLRSVVLLFIKS